MNHEEQLPAPHQPGAWLPGPGPCAGGRGRSRDIIIISGLDDIGIGVTICDKDNPVGLPVLPVTNRR